MSCHVSIICANNLTTWWNSMKFFSKLRSGHPFSSSFCLMRNIQGPEVPPALPILTIVIESRLSWVFFLCFFTSAEPTTQRTPVLPRMPVLSKLIWKNGWSFLYSSEGWLIVWWSSQTLSISLCHQSCCSIWMHERLVVVACTLWTLPWFLSSGIFFILTTLSKWLSHCFVVAKVNSFMSWITSLRDISIWASSWHLAMPAMKARIGSDIKLWPSDVVMALPPEFNRAGGFIVICQIELLYCFCC